MSYNDGKNVGVCSHIMEYNYNTDELDSDIDSHGDNHYHGAKVCNV